MPDERAGRFAEGFEVALIGRPRAGGAGSAHIHEAHLPLINRDILQHVVGPAAAKPEENGIRPVQLLAGFGQSLQPLGILGRGDQPADPVRFVRRHDLACAPGHNFGESGGGRGTPENEMVLALYSLEAELENGLQPLGTGPAAEISEIFCATVIRRRRELEAAGETPPRVLN